MKIDDIINSVNTKLNNWFKSQDENVQFHLGDSISHLHEEVLSADKYHSESTIDDVMKQLSKFLDKSKNFPDMAKEQRIYLVKNTISILEEVKAEPMKKEVDSILNSVSNYIETLPDKENYTQAFNKLEKLFKLLVGLKQKNVNLPDIMLSQYKFQSLNLGKEDKDIFENIYRVANETATRDQVKGQQQAVIQAHSNALAELPLHESTSFKLGFERTLIDIVDYKGDSFDLLLKVMNKELELDKYAPESQEEIDFNKGKKLAIDSFSNFYQKPTQSRYIKKEKDEVALTN